MAFQHLLGLGLRPGRGLGLRPGLGRGRLPSLSKIINLSRETYWEKSGKQISYLSAHLNTKICSN